MKKLTIEFQAIISGQSYEGKATLKYWFFFPVVSEKLEFVKENLGASEILLIRCY